MNQHFNKLTVEAAIRVAIVNPNEYIYINGKRSKNRLAALISRICIGRRKSTGGFKWRYKE